MFEDIPQMASLSPVSLERRQNGRGRMIQENSGWCAGRKSQALMVSCSSSTTASAIKRACLWAGEMASADESVCHQT